jgi:pimeloyl-ACP methyl ester carboxylesterase
MPQADANGLRLEYETFGRSSDDPLLLVMGLGAQMILWPDDFCRQLADRGHFVVRFDNRDIGLSTKLDHLGLPDIMQLAGAAMMRQPIEAPYLLADMASDAAGLLDALGLETAHVVGASMGGMIVQQMAIDHPRRLRSMTSIMSTTGHPDLPPAKPEAMQALLTPVPPDREGAIERGVSVFRTIGSPGFPFDEAMFREQAARAFDRCFYPDGVVRQLAAILASGSRREKLRQVKTPSLVIHGKADPLVPVEGGIDTAEAIPGAEILLIEGMGHDLPQGAWAAIIDAISRRTGRA